MKKRILKRISAALSALLLTSIIFGSMPVSAMNYGVGTWDDANQGYRFSLYDADGILLSSCDVLTDTPNCNNTSGTFSNGKIAYLDEFNESSYTNHSRHFTGDRLSYIRQYNSEGRVDLISTSNYTPVMYIGENGMGNIAGMFGKTGLFSNSCPLLQSPRGGISYNNIHRYAYTDNGTAKIKSLFKSADASFFAAFLSYQPYYRTFDSHSGYESFRCGDIKDEFVDAIGVLNDFIDNRYTLIIEPVYWYTDIWSSNQCLYGTITEIAIFTYQNNAGSEHISYDKNGKAVINTLYSAMANLPFQDGWLGLTNASDATLFSGSIIPDYEMTIPKADRSAFPNQNQATKAYVDFCMDKINGYNYTNYYAQPLDKTYDLLLSGFGIDIVRVNDTTDLQIEQTTGIFRENTEVCLSFEITNRGFSDYIPSVATGTALTATLKTTDDSDIGFNIGGIERSTTELELEVLPVNGKTYMYTYIKTPEFTPLMRENGDILTLEFELTITDRSGKKLIYTSSSGDVEVVAPESSASYSLGKFTATVSALPVTEPPDPAAGDSGASFRPTVFDGSSYTPVTYLEWTEYSVATDVDGDYIKDADGKYVINSTLKRETTSLADARIYLPCTYDNVTSAYISSATGELVLRSGYGFGIGMSRADTVRYGCDGYQHGVVLLPEYNYAGCGKIIENDGGDYLMEQNSNSQYYTDLLHSDYSRVHFTPLWYPDGNYVITVFMFDKWTPAGMMWDLRTFNINIDGSVYDDWYITRHR